MAPNLRATVLDASTNVGAGRRATLIGGSPLRLFRLTAAGALRRDRCRRGRRRRRRLTDRLLDAGAIHPVARSTTRWAPPPTSPSSCPRSSLAETALDEILRLPGRRRGHRRRRRLRRRRSPAFDGATLVRLRSNAGPAAAATPVSAPSPRRWSPSSTPTSTCTRGGSTACSVTSTTSASPPAASGPAAAGRGHGARYEEGHSPLDLGPNRRGSRRAPASATSRAAARRPHRSPSAIGGFDARCARRGRRRRLAPRRGRVAVPVRAGVVVHHQPRG